MPTREVLASFWRDWERLTPQQQRAFRQAVGQFIADLADGGRGFRPRLRVKRMQGDEVLPGESHIVWRRIGTHSVFRRP